MAIKVYGSMLSTATLRVLLCLSEKDLDFELINVELAAGEHKQPHILARNPFGQIPAFEDGDVELFESRAISEYIARMYNDKGTCLINTDPKKAAIESVYHKVKESHRFDPIMVKLAWELCMKRMLFGQKGDEVIVEAEKKRLESVLDVYETRLKDNKYLGGDSFSLADLYHVPMIKLMMDTEIKKVFESRPNVNAWVEDILARPACLKVFGVPVY
ncbi:glutathione S-transferase APIC-like [Rutidosis leptorrhynchoides]|uniref:glutathione S-transferase APIC-like n=1 Tax=Rutidosis leptorrhynchoides TaxID=125765 RepID=UPI003A997760